MLLKNRLQRCNSVLIALLLCIPAWSQTDYYVSAAGSDSNNGLTKDTPFKTISKAASEVSAGGTVFIMDGTYSSSNGPLLDLRKSGTESQYITFKSYPGHAPKLTALGNVWNAISINGNYVVVEGLELQGNNANITYEAAYQSYQDYINGGRDWASIANFNTNGITVGGPNAQSLFPHHVIIRNCKVHDFPGGGVVAQQADYVTFEGNTVFNNAWYMMYGGSGISILTPFNHDGNTSYRNIVRNNTVYNNKTLVPWEEVQALSDGNGIIIDVNIDPVYNGRTLVENNVSYNNGGSGIHAYKAAHVDIINNTAYNNGNVVGYAEIYGDGGYDVKIYNNIMYARYRGACNSNSSAAVYDYNIYFNGPASRKGPNDIEGDPKFVKLGLDGSADFRLRSNSPAINSGTDTPGMFSSEDRDGIDRPFGAKPDRGAYESSFIEPTVIPQIRVKQEDTFIVNSSGKFDFGGLLFNTPKTITFVLDNVGGNPLSLTGSPRVSVAGTGFSLVSDAAPAVDAGNNTTFQIALTTNSEIEYAGVVTIQSNDPYESPFTFSIGGRGMDPAKAFQTILFNALPVKNTDDDDFDPGATVNSGLPITYTSSDTRVATIVNGKVHIVGVGTSIITASQPGNSVTHAAAPVKQSLTVTPVMYREGNNLVANSSFDASTAGWSLNFQNSAAANASSNEKGGYSTFVGKVNISSFGNTSSEYNVQFGHTVSVVAGKSYRIMFKASADLPSWITLILIENASPYKILFSKSQISLSPIPTTFGPFTFTATATQSLALRFLLGLASPAVYIDDVEMFEVGAPPVVTSTEEATKDPMIDIYPNPVVNQVLNVSTQARSGQEIVVSVFTLAGRCVYSATNYSLESGSNTFAHNVQTRPGLYLVEIKNRNGRFVKLVSIQ